MTKHLLAGRLDVFLALMLLLVHTANAQRLTRYVTDQTGTLKEAEVEALGRTLADFEKSTSTQLAVVVVPALTVGTIEQEALRIAEENGIGRRQVNNGVLLFIAKEDRQIRIEVGYGLEAVLTDAMAGVIIRREIVPRFREGDFFGGIRSGVDAIIAVTRNEYTSQPEDEGGARFLPIIFMIVLALVFAARNHRRRFLGGGFPTVFLPGSSRGYSGWSGGGGFRGGGGSFGGGGASGRW
jgi:uncharacterized protein